MKLLVTGCCGFIGSNFVNYYFKNNEDIEIVNLDAMYYCASELNIQENIRKSKRSNNCLDTTALELDNTNNIKSIKDAVREILITMKENKKE